MMTSNKIRIASAILGLGVFWPLAFLLEREFLFDATNALAVAVGCGVVAVYGRTALQGFQEKTCTAGHLLVGGIALAWLSTIIRLAITWIWRLLDNPSELSEHLLLAFSMWLLFIGGALHITARNASGTTIPTKNWIALSLAVSAGCILAVLLIMWDTN